jgi:flagellar hook assembly protein FlgD
MDIEISKTIPSLFELFTPYPNPFNPTTTIRFSSEKFLENSLLQIYNIKGHIVETLLNKSIHPGDHKVKWNAKFLPSGVYFIKFTDGQSFQIQKVVLVK